MGKRPTVLSIIILLLVAACTTSEGTIDTGPRLVSDVTLGPATQTLATRMLSPTPLGRTPEVVSPLDVVTVDAEFVLVTPTLPPSKTPTETPTISPTPPPTFTPTFTATSTNTAPILPTSVIIPVTGAVVIPIPEVCDSTWFFIQPRPANCPLNPPIADQGVYQQFQNGYMVWVRNQDAIYVMYSDNTQPRWEVFRDFFNEGMVEDESTFNNRPPNTWQPRRGFGLLWRGNERVRNRIGWAIQQWEQPYSVQVQTADDGTIFISEPRNAIFGLVPNGINWNLYASGGF